MNAEKTQLLWLSTAGEQPMTCLPVTDEFFFTWLILRGILSQSVKEMTNYTFCQGNGVTAPEEKRTDR